MDNPFLRSLFVQPPVVLGKQLRHFSAYHAAALMLLDSPFMTKDRAKVGSTDLVLAVYVCSHGFEDGPQSLFPSPPLATLEEWGKVTRDEDLDHELAVFEQYLADYMVLPQVEPWEHGGKESGMPGPFCMVATVLRHMAGLSEAEAWDMPFSRLASYRAAVAEGSGWEVLDDRQVALLKLAEELNAKARGEQADA